MAVKWETVKAGDVLFDAHRVKAGNTTRSVLRCWRVKIIDIDHAAGKATASWNGNAPKTMYRYQVERFRRSEPKKHE